jgi:autotransporter-associated beta strand protein
VTANAGTLYLTTQSWTFANPLTLNGGTLRQGGANNKLLTWNGAVNVTTDSTIRSDGGTAGIAIHGDVTLNSGATLFSTVGGTAHTISGSIGGTGNLVLTSGLLTLEGSGSYSGTTTINGGTLRPQGGGTLPSGGNLVINGTGNFNVRNTTGWLYNGTITGDGSGTINLNTGTNATLAGNISGVANINANSASTDVTITGAIGGAANVNVQNSGNPILRLGGPNTYSGNTTVQAGTLVLAANHVLPDTTAVTLVNGKLDAATSTDAAGTLAVTGNAIIQLGTGTALAFADSSAVTWTGTLDITGSFVAGSSLRFGTTNAGLTSTQLALITLNGVGGNLALNPDGYLIDATAFGFDAWKTANNAVGQTLTDDHDGDGVRNGIEYFLGGSADTTGFTPLPAIIDTGGTFTVTWTMAADYNGAYGTDFVVESTPDLATGNWTTEVLGGNVTITDKSVTYVFPAGGNRFVRLKVTGP